VTSVMFRGECSTERERGVYRTEGRAASSGVTHAQYDSKPAQWREILAVAQPAGDDATTATTGSTKECNFLQRRAALAVNLRGGDLNAMICRQSCRITNFCK
jgi:hypothetical protein